MLVVINYKAVAGLAGLFEEAIFLLLCEFKEPTDAGVIQFNYSLERLFNGTAKHNFILC
jgi:hypothetical protein